MSRQAVLDHTRTICKLLFLLCILLAGQQAFAAGTMDNPQSEASPAPYFHITSGADDGTEQFPLKSTETRVKLNGVIASVVLTQTYSNLGTTPVNASYVFPGSTRAAVNGMKMTIGERTVTAEIREKEAAKTEFEKAKAEGKSASLLAQKRPNVFSMDVANIMPGDIVKVELSYTEILSAEDGQYEFVIPGVVGPRFGGDAHLTSAETEWISNPFLANDDTKSDPVNYSIDIKMKSPIAIQDLKSISHSPQIDWLDESSATIKQQGDAGEVGNRDFILHYRLQDGKIVSGISHYTWNGDNYFMLLAEPPEHVPPQSVTAREYFFIMDVSGSMHGFPLDVASEVMIRLLDGMRPTDRFNIMFFSGGSQTLSPAPLPATRENIANAKRMMKKIKGSGGTQLHHALKTALAMPRAENMSRNMVVVTDGYISADDAVFRLISDNLDRGNVFTFGIGSSVNRHLIEGMAKAGHAESFIVTNHNEAEIHSERFLKYISSPVLTGIELSSPNAEIIDMQPSHIPDMLGERPVLIMGKYKPGAGGQASFHLSGTSAHGTKTWDFSLSEAQEDHNLPQLWARKRLEDLYVIPLKSSDDTRKSITELGLKYSLLTRHTSFIAVDDMVRNNTGSSKDVKQPLPLPAGVSNYAVGGHAMPEPELAILLVFMAIILMHVYRNNREARA